jgi:hypothetical protein
VKVHFDEGVATHVAPDLCAGVREGVGEASVGERSRAPYEHWRVACQRSQARGGAVSEPATESVITRCIALG